MTTIQDILDVLHAWAPPSTAQPYDNVGLLVGDPTRKVQRVLVALDLTPEVVDEAVGNDVELVITHHPLLFHPLRALTPTAFVSRLAWRLVRNGIGCLAAHTNLDAAPGGVSFVLAERLGAIDLRPLDPIPEHPDYGLGVVGRLREPKPLADFLDTVCSALDTPAVRYAGDPSRTIHVLAACGGAGDGLIGAALDAGADAYVTSDLRYHAYFEPLDASGEPRMALIDAGHYETEAPAEALLVGWLRERFDQVDFRRASGRTGPARYHLAPR